MKDIEQRKLVMARARQIGHCVCNLKKTCPCDMLREKDICICAGEENPNEQSDPDKA